MDLRIPEANKKPGLVYVCSEDGIELPVIDLTHPAFEVSSLESQLGELTRSFIQSTRQRERVPKFISRLMVRIFLRGSVLAGSLQRASGKFLPGMSTYLFKLGPDNLGAYAKPIDRTIAGSLPGVTMRLRLHDMSRLLADAMAPALSADPARPLLMPNIGGGPCIDSINALLMLHRRHPEVLRGRSIRIVAFDLQSEGPAFGARALDALRSPGGPLAQVDAQLQHVRYDWSHPEALAAHFTPWRDEGTFAAMSSEGALFEYGNDETVDANLRALASCMPEDGVIVGSVTSDSEAAALLQKESTVQLQPRSEEAFRALAARSGWQLRRVIDRPMTRNCLLAR